MSEHLSSYETRKALQGSLVKYIRDLIRNHNAPGFLSSALDKEGFVVCSEREFAESDKEALPKVYEGFPVSYTVLGFAVGYSDPGLR